MSAYYLLFFYLLPIHKLLVYLRKKEDMPYTLTITDNNPQALAFVQYAKKLDFVKVTKNKDFKEVVTPIDDLEEDEYGIPIKYRDKIMAMSKESNKNIARRWREDLAKKREKEAI